MRYESRKFFENFGTDSLPTAHIGKRRPKHGSLKSHYPKRRIKSWIYLKVLAIVDERPHRATQLVVSVDGTPAADRPRRNRRPRAGAAATSRRHANTWRIRVKGKEVFVQSLRQRQRRVSRRPPSGSTGTLDQHGNGRRRLRAWYDPRHPEYKTISEAQQKAKAGKLGLWSDGRIRHHRGSSRRKAAPPVERPANWPSTTENRPGRRAFPADMRRCSNRPRVYGI